MKALLEHGIRPREDWLLSDRDKDSGRIREELLWLPADMPTAFFCNCDLTAGMLIQKLREKGYRVPEDIAVAGFDNYIYPGSCDVGITTYEVNLAGMASQAVSILIGRMEKDPESCKTHVVGGRLVIRDSTENRA